MELLPVVAVMLLFVITLVALVVATALRSEDAARRFGDRPQEFEDAGRRFGDEPQASRRYRPPTERSPRHRDAA